MKSCSISLIVAAAAAKLPQLCPTLCNPIDGIPPGSSVPGILQARILEWVVISFSVRGMLFKTINRYHFTHSRMAIIFLEKKNKNSGQDLKKN